MFHSIEKAKSFSEKEKLFLEKEIVLYDFTKVIDMADHISNSEDCRILFNTWNFFSDLERTLNEKFIGDLDEKQILKIYDKLFYGCNLEVINEGKEKYSPCFDDDERKKIILIRNEFKLGMPYVAKCCKINDFIKLDFATAYLIRYATKCEMP